MRFGVVLFVKDLGTANGNITIRVELLDASTSFLYGFFDTVVPKAPANTDMATVVDAGLQLFLPINVKARIKIKSDQASDTAVTWDGWAYDVNYPTIDLDALLDGKTVKQVLQLMAAVLAGQTTGAGTGTEKFRSLDNSADRVTATIDAATGNRTGVTYTG